MSVDDVVYGMKALNRAVPEYEMARDYAVGTIPETFASKVLRQQLAESDDYRFRLAAVPLRVMVDRVSVASVSSERGEAVTSRIEAIRTANHMEMIEPYLIRELFTFGDAYSFIYPLTDEEAEAPGLDDALVTAGVRISYLSPFGTRAIYDSGDPLTPLYVIRRWQVSAPEGDSWRAELWYADRMEPWMTGPGASGLDPVEWIKDISEGEWPIMHDFGEIPIKHARTDLPYGRPEHIDAYGPQDAITKAIITQVTTIEAHGWPERIRLMDDAAILDTARDAVAWTDDSDAPDVADGITGTETTALRRGPGTETKYHGTKQLVTVDPPDPRRLIDPLEQWVRLMATATQTPLYEFDARTGQQLSGVARERADRPLRAKEKDRKRYLASFVQETYRLALNLQGIDPGVIVVNWSLPEVTTDPEFWTTAQVREAMGVPIAQILAEANYSPDLIEEWLDRQAEATTLDRRIARLQALADALQAMGTATSLGAVDEVTAQTLISSILEEATPVPEGDDGA